MSILERAEITFVNGECITVSDGELPFPIIQVERDGKKFASTGEPVQLVPNIHNGLVPNILDMLCASEFFSVTADYDKVYKSSAVLSVAQL